MKKRCLGLILFCLTLFCLTVSVYAQDDKTYDLVQLGQSYRTPMSMVEAFAESRGHTFSRKEYLPPGVSIYWHWFRMKGGNRSIIGETDYKVMCLVPYYDFKDESPMAAANFFGLGLERNPEMRSYLVNHWPSRAMPMEEKAEWIKEFLPKFEAMVKKANVVHPGAKHPMRLVPRAEAFMGFLRYAEQIPGFTAPYSAYNDGGHQSNNSNYMFACMEYAFIYGESPIGLPKEKTVKTRKGDVILFRLTDAQALALQRIGYHHLLSHPMSGVEVPEDKTAPSQPQNVQSSAAPKSVTLTWPEVQDEGAGVYQYKIKRSDGEIFDNVIARYEDHRVKSGTEYSYQIVTVDFAGNESTASSDVKVAVPVDEQAPQIAKVIADGVAESVRIVFDEAVNADTAGEVSNYSIEGLEAKSVRMAESDTVVLQTSTMKEGIDYTLTAKSIADLADTSNVAESLAATYRFTPPTWKTFDMTGWDETVVELEGPQLRVTTKGPGSFPNRGEIEKLSMAGIVRDISGDFDIPLAITSQGQVAATTNLKPFQRKGNVKTGFFVCENLDQIKQGNYTAFYLDDSTRFKMIVHKSWLITGRVIGAGLSAGDPRKNRDGLNLPVWIRLKREGKALTAYYSLTGVAEEDWEKLGTIEAQKMPDTLQLGIFNLSGVEDEHSTAMFDLRATGQEKSYTNIGE